MSRATSARARPGVDEVHYAFAATDEFGRRNQNATTAQGVETALSLVRRARADRMPITVTVSVAFGCPFEGPVPPERVLGIVERLMEVPADEIGLADTIGVGVPSQVDRARGWSPEAGRDGGRAFSQHAQHGLRERGRGP